MPCRPPIPNVGLLLRRCSGKGLHLAMAGEPRGFSRVTAGFSSYEESDTTEQLPLLHPCREPVRHSARDKGHEEGGSAYAKAGLSLRSPPGYSRASTPKKPESAQPWREVRHAFYIDLFLFMMGDLVRHINIQ